MSIIKVYDAVCFKCGNWYGSRYQQPQVKNEKEAIAEMKQNGWAINRTHNFCDDCNKSK